MQKKVTIHDIHIGDYIKRVAAKRGVSESQLAKMISRDPSAISRMYTKKTISTEQLWHISNVLEYNFFRKYAKIMDSVLQNEPDSGTITIVVSSEKVTVEEETKIPKITEYHKKRA